LTRWGRSRAGQTSGRWRSLAERGVTRRCGGVENSLRSLRAHTAHAAEMRQCCSARRGCLPTEATWGSQRQRLGAHRWQHLCLIFADQGLVEQIPTESHRETRCRVMWRCSSAKCVASRRGGGHLASLIHPTACNTQVDEQYPRRINARRDIAQSRSRSPSRSPLRPRGVAPRRAQSSSPEAGPNEGRIKQRSTLPAESDIFRLDPTVAVRVHSSHSHSRGRLIVGSRSLCSHRNALLRLCHATRLQVQKMMRGYLARRRVKVETRVQTLHSCAEGDLATPTRSCA